jgi:hypothetical protein
MTTSPEKSVSTPKAKTTTTTATAVKKTVVRKTAAVKASVKTAAKPARKASTPPVKKLVSKTVSATKTARVAKPVTASKPPKLKKTKMVRDSMTIPKAEYAVLDTLKLRAAKLSKPTKKTELLRAGIKALAAMSDASFLLALKAVPSLKTGRPGKS